MRKLALLLGSLVVVASASAKEVVPAPVVVEEAPVQIVEKEVIVYRDKEEGFRPNGNIGLEYKYYGNTESQNHDDWNSANNYSRTQLSGGIQMTEAQKLEFRIRDYNSLDQENDRQTKVGTETRLRYFYNHGNLGDSKVNLTSRIEYKDTTSNAQYVEYQPRFDFAEYLFNNDFIKTTKAVIAPKYRYEWSTDNSSDYSNQVGADLEYTADLPLGFDIELNVYNTYFSYGTEQEFKPENGKVEKGDNNFTTDVELYLHFNANLYTNGKYSLDLGTEWGYDPYNAYNEKTDDRNYYLKADQWVTLNYAATEFVNVYLTGGAEYGNFTRTHEGCATNWRWQPYVAAGFNVAF